jgi:hypothetical protein
MSTMAACSSGGGYFRIQLKHGGQYLDAAYCGNTITLNSGSDYEGGACELWRFVPAGSTPSQETKQLDSYDRHFSERSPTPRKPRPTPTRQSYGNDNQAEPVQP